MKKRWITVTAAALTAAMTVCACAKEEEKTTFTGETAEEPAYQAYLNAISPAAYNNVEGLNLEPGTYISIIGKDESSAYWQQVEKGAMQAADDLNETLGYTGSDKIKVTYNAPSKSEDIDEQVNILDEELSRYPDVVGIAAVDQEACKVQFELAAANGIPVIALDSANSYHGIQCTVETDNHEAARTGAYKLADEIGREGEVILLVHDSKSETAKTREEGFTTEITEKYPNVKIVETIYLDRLDDLKKKVVEEKSQGNTESDGTEGMNQGDGDTAADDGTDQSDGDTAADDGTDQNAGDTGAAESEKNENTEMTEEEISAAAAEMTDEDVLQYYLEKYPNLKGVFATSDNATQIGLDALKTAGRNGEVTLMGFDAGKDQIAALEDGDISGLVVQNPFGIGYASVVAAARTVLEIGNEAEVTTGYTWVTQDNVEEESIQKMLYE